MKKRRRILWRRLILWLSSMVLFVGFLYTYFGTGFFTIRSYDLEGVPDQYKEQIISGMNLLAEQKLFYSLPGNRIISYHNDDIRMLIQETLTNTRDISIYPKNLRTLHVSVKAHTPVFAVSDTHAITENSIVYKEIVSLADYPRLQISSSTAVTRKQFNSLSKLVTNISSVMFPIKYIDIDEYNDIRLYDDERNAAVILSLSSDMGKIWSNILSAIDTEPLKNKLITEPENLEYLDARFGNKVFYRFTDPSAPVIIPPTHATSTATTSLQ